jgi:N6-adenosine-specific RNA methylase IME4
MGKYQTVVIDFPWEVHNNLTDARFYRCGLQRMPYKTMEPEEILNFPINDFADDRCDLFLWTITSKIPFCFDILKRWNFKYMDLIAWDKEIGVAVNGIYRRVEWAIYAYRGKMGLKRSGHIIQSLIKEKRKKHSQKPDSFYEILVTNTLEPRIDIFARKRHFGFDAYGDQVEKQIQKSLC